MVIASNCQLIRFFSLFLNVTQTCSVPQLNILCAETPGSPSELYFHLKSCRHWRSHPGPLSVLSGSGQVRSAGQKLNFYLRQKSQLSITSERERTEFVKIFSFCPGIFCLLLPGLSSPHSGLGDI